MDLELRDVNILLICFLGFVYQYKGLYIHTCATVENVV